MTPERFNDLLENRLSLTRDVLGSKAGEYASTSDRLHNFKAAAAMLRGTPEQALLGMLVKHMVSIYDMVLDGQPRAIALWNEKIGDAINYMILLEALVKEGEPATATVVSSYDATHREFARVFHKDPCCDQGCCALRPHPTTVPHYNEVVGWWS